MTWKWFGQAGHFIAADWCRFHLHTHVGRWCVSTIGDYHPMALDALRSVEEQPQTIGLNRLYETMVFALIDGETDGSEVDFEGYNDRDSANAGHIAMCEKYAAVKEGSR